MDWQTETRGTLWQRFQHQLAEGEPSERSFTFLLAAVSAIVAWKPLHWWAPIVALLFLLPPPRLFRSVKRAWLFLGFLIGLVVSPIVLALLFYLVITPAAIISRAFGRDALALKPVAGATYWKEKQQSISGMKDSF